MKTFPTRCGGPRSGLCRRPSRPCWRFRRRSYGRKGAGQFAAVGLMRANAFATPGAGGIEGDDAGLGFRISAFDIQHLNLHIEIAGDLFIGESELIARSPDIHAAGGDVVIRAVGDCVGRAGRADAADVGAGQHALLLLLRGCGRGDFVAGGRLCRAVGRDDLVEIRLAGGHILILECDRIGAGGEDRAEGSCRESWRPSTSKPVSLSGIVRPGKIDFRVAGCGDLQIRRRVECGCSAAGARAAGRGVIRLVA